MTTGHAHCRQHTSAGLSIASTPGLSTVARGGRSRLPAFHLLFSLPSSVPVAYSCKCLDSSLASTEHLCWVKTSTKSLAVLSHLTFIPPGGVPDTPFVLQSHCPLCSVPGRLTCTNSWIRVEPRHHVETSQEGPRWRW